MRKQCSGFDHPFFLLNGHHQDHRPQHCPIRAENLDGRTMTSPMLTSNLEDYLETIFHIIEDKQAARVKEIAKRLGVNNSSVTGALKSLASKGFLNYAPYDVITMTEAGEKAARDVIRRHEVMKRFITDILSLDEALAEEAACRMEHSVTPEVLERIVRLVEFTQVCPRSGREWVQGFRRFCENEFTIDMCQANADQCLGDLENIRRTCTTAETDPVPLAEARQGDKARLIRCRRTAAIAGTFSRKGITPGSLIQVTDIEPSTGDIQIDVRGYHLTVRNDDARKIDIVIY